MLDDTLITPGDKQARRRRWLLLPLSLLVHAAAIAALVVVPLLLAERGLPEVRVTSVLVARPPLPAPPPPPPPPPPKRRGSGAPPAQAGPDARRPVLAGRLVAPIAVPVAIADDEGSDFGVEGGVPGGVPGGVEGGVEGGVVGGVLGGVLGGDLPANPPVFVSGRGVPKLIREVKPEYPPQAYAARLQAVVIVEATTDIYGRVSRARVISGPPLFSEAALAAVRRFLYEPYIVDGVPRPIYFTVAITFGLTQR